ncbi:MAG: DUF839 domain-containing protein [Zoogloea sp.]|nr:DUF839 domain-containing protein [Zoogloea sp.]
MSQQLGTTPETSLMNDGEVANPSTNTHIQDIIDVRLSRRGVLKGGIAATTTALFGSLGMAACGGNGSSRHGVPPLGFEAVAKNLNDKVTVPAGYEVSILHALGDPLSGTDAAWADNGSESAESYNRRVGDGHDGMHYFGLSDSGSFDAKRSDKGLLCVNHEYVVGPNALHP